MKVQDRVFLSCALGSTITWYDFTIFVTATALVFKQVFFQGAGDYIPLLIFAMGFVMRPLGSLIFGHFGDRIGRKKTLIATLYLTGLATVMIGLLPTGWGIYATMLLLLARILQALALGGEWAATSTMLMEYNSGNPRMGFVTSVISSGWAVGSILSALVFMAMTSLGDQEFKDWGWRVPFLISAVLMVLGIYVRRNISETPAFQQVVHNQQVVKVPAWEFATKYWKKLFASILAMQLTAAWVYVVMIFAVTYVLDRGLAVRADITQAQLIASVAMFVALMFWGWIGDKVGRINLFMLSSVISILAIWPVFYFIEQGNVIVPMLLLTVTMCPAFAASPGFFNEIYESRVRQTGSGLTFGLGTVIGAGLIPILAQNLLSSTGTVWSAAWMFVLLSVISLAGIRMLKNHDNLIEKHR